MNAQVMSEDIRSKSTPLAEPVIRLEHISKRFGDIVAIQNLSFDVGRGEIVAFLGRTGAGKSTTMNIIMGNMKPSSGTVRILGFDPNKDFHKLGHLLAVGFQTDRLLPWRTALQNVELGLQILREPKATVRTKAEEWLARVKLEHAAHLYPHELSGGMRQRVSLARALAIDPEVLLLDECFGQLDHVTSQSLRGDITQLIKDYGKTCLFITHRIEDAIEMADRILVLGAPARLLLEERPDARDRTDKDAFDRLHTKIADALGADEK